MLLTLTALPAQSQDGTKNFTIEVDRINNKFTVYPIDQLFIWRELQTRYDSSKTKEVYYKRVIAQKDSIIKETVEDNTQLQNTVIQVQPTIDKQREENEKLKSKNKKLGFGFAIAVIGVIAQTIILLK